MRVNPYTDTDAFNINGAIFSAVCSFSFTYLFLVVFAFPRMQGTDYDVITGILGCQCDVFNDVINGEKWFYVENIMMAFIVLSLHLLPKSLPDCHFYLSCLSSSVLIHDSSV